MALITAASIVSDIRGSVATETYSRNQGGLYVKTRKGPTDNTGANRDACRATITALSQAWSGTLNEAQRAAWRKYAHQHPKPDRWGSVHLVNGYTRFIRANFYRYRLDTTIPFADPPDQADLHQPPFTFTAHGAGDTVTIALPPANYDPPWPKLELFAYGGDNVSPGVNFYDYNWRYLARNEFVVADYVVTGNPNPDCKGIYADAGEYGGERYYERLDAAYTIWWDGASWNISTELGEKANGLPGHWSRMADIQGEYAPTGYTGNPVVTATANRWTSDPWTIDYPLDLVATDKVFLKLFAQKSDTGELSRPYRTSAIIA